MWELAHETAFYTFLTYGALPKRGIDAFAAISSIMAELLQVKEKRLWLEQLCMAVTVKWVR